ncbi:hypothetical protein HanXRQr2_Chr03g0101831 [Helianthus annuus]|uniref:Uncharacterized protein n=1 Tax=Helianthus annuus TaxID=4232 RepID=A0A9K3JFJ0_HELAN|nr:hypothetical protein HanXRQr2_Chr03g0101831 [Helianthus annuus]
MSERIIGEGENNNEVDDISRQRMFGNECGGCAHDVQSESSKTLRNIHHWMMELINGRDCSTCMLSAVKSFQLGSRISF